MFVVAGKKRPIHVYVSVSEIIGPASFSISLGLAMLVWFVSIDSAWSEVNVESKKPSEGQDSNILVDFDRLGTESLSFFGSTFSEATNSHFFERFNFRQYAFSVTDDGFTEILLRLPRLKQGRPFVQLTLAVNQSGKIIRSNLKMKRRYIEDKIHGAFARDYAKSFVQGAVSFKSQERVDVIANEIFYRQNLKTRQSSKSSLSETADLKEGDIVIISGASGKIPEIPTLPKHFSEMYRCFLGEIKDSKMKLDDAQLKFSNQKINGEDTLVISVEENGYEHPEAKSKNVDFENLPMHVPSI